MFSINFLLVRLRRTFYPPVSSSSLSDPFSARLKGTYIISALGLGSFGGDPLGVDHGNAS
jgi:hypothetical protein